MQTHEQVTHSEKVTMAASSLSPIHGEMERLRLPLKGGRTVRLIFSGSMPTQADISKLIALLELTKDTFPSKEEEGSEIDGVP